MAITFTLPRTFDPLEFLPPPLMMYADYARYLMNLILTKLAHGRVDDRGHVRLHAKFLKAVMQQHYKPIVDALVDGGAIRRIPYTPQVKSYGYAIGERYATDKHVRHLATHPALIRQLSQRREEMRAEIASRMKPIHRHLGRLQRQLEVDTGRAAEILAKLPNTSNPYGIQGILIDDIENRRFRLNVSRWGRVSNSITNLKRELRRTLHVHGEQLASVDVSCCQPALVALLMTMPKIPANGVKGMESYNGSLFGSPASCPASLSVCPSPYKTLSVQSAQRDFGEFRNLVCRGQLYEFLLDRVNENGDSVTRDELKHHFLANVLAKKKANKRGDEYPSVVENVFRAEFPTVYQFIRSVNCDGWHHANLIRRLQQAESWLVIENVCQRFADRHPRTFAITLHDAVFCRARHVEAVSRAFRDVFRELDFEMKLKVEG